MTIIFQGSSISITNLLELDKILSNDDSSIDICMVVVTTEFKPKLSTYLQPKIELSDIECIFVDDTMLQQQQ